MSYQEYREQLRSIISERSLRLGDYTLQSGRQTSFYFDTKQTTLTGEGAYHIATLAITLIKKEFPQVTTIGGPAMGANFIVPPLLWLDAQSKSPQIRHGFIVYKEGNELRVANSPPSGTEFVGIEDVITTGESVSRACRYMIERGCILRGLLCLIDRSEGGVKRLEDEFGVPAIPLFTVRDFFPRV